MHSKLIRSASAIAATLALAGSLLAQAQLSFPAPSPASTIKQRVGITDVEINYSRPGVKGRVVFGDLVPYGEIWRTGANQATKISFSTPVKLNGADVPAGTYELHTIPGADEWTVIIHKDMSQWGSYSYKQENDVARVTAKPLALESSVETFTIDINDLRDESATLNLVWDRTHVPVKIEVDVAAQLVPQIETAMAAPEGKKPYFPAAMFYFSHNIDLNKALEWMNAGLAEQPNAFWMHYRKGLILAKLGDKDGARAAANTSLELASQSPSQSLRDEYARLNGDLIASLK